MTTPHRFSANGTVYNTLPLVYNDTIIDDFHLTFKDGVVVDWACGKNAEVLAGILNTDEGSRRLGEIALVPYDSPIRRSGVLFYNTLFDENASCHMALGAGYIDVLHGKDRPHGSAGRAGTEPFLSACGFHVRQCGYVLHGDDRRRARSADLPRWRFCHLIWIDASIRIDVNFYSGRYCASAVCISGKIVRFIRK